VAKAREVTTHICIYSTGSDADEGAFEIGRRQRARGALSIGYHFVVRKDGLIEAGRPHNEIGLHDSSMNRCSVAIIVACKDEPSIGQELTLKELVEHVQENYPTAINVLPIRKA
jgi:N-acetylmuramoyl-L-alanine amidase